MEADGNVDLFRRDTLLDHGTFHGDDGVYVEETTDAGVLPPGRYLLQYAFAGTGQGFFEPVSFSYDVSLAVPDPATRVLLVAAPSFAFLRRRRLS